MWLLKNYFLWFDSTKIGRKIQENNENFDDIIKKNVFFIIPLMLGQLLRWLLPAFLITFFVFIITLLLKKFLLVLDSIVSIVICISLIFLSIADKMREKKEQNQAEINNFLRLEYERMAVEIVAPVTGQDADFLKSDFCTLNGFFYFSVDFSSDIDEKELLLIKRKLERRLCKYYGADLRYLRKNKVIVITKSYIAIKFRSE